MRKSLDQFVIRAVIEFVAAAVILCSVSLTVYNRIDILLIDSLREAVARQSQNDAYTLGERFQHKLDELRMRAKMLQERRFPAEELVDVETFGTEGGRVKGILQQDFSVIAGSYPPEEAAASLRERFGRGEAIDYLPGAGLLFAVPFELDGKPCVFYEIFDDDAIRTFYRTLSYNGKGTLILAKTFGKGVSLSEGLYPEVAELKVPDFYNTWFRMGSSELSPGKAITFYDENETDAFFFHCTRVSERDRLLLYGYVEWDDIVVGVDYIYTMMQFIFCITLGLMFFAVRYTMRTRQAMYLEHEKTVADSANRAKSDFLANMSHEIRTPINAIMGMDEMILRESKEPATLEYACNLQHAAKSLLGIINDILDLSKIEAGKMEIIPVEYRLGSMLNDLVNIVRKRAEGKGLELRVEVNRETPDSLYGDEIRIRQIVTNLLTNAVKYTEHGMVTLKVGYVPIDEASMYLCISVTDTGIGIKPEDMEKLFSAFERIEEKRNRTIEGTGLGMNISRRLLSMMGAELVVDSVYGQGSNFSFQVMQRVTNPVPIGDFEEAYRRSLSHRKEYRESFTAPEASILIVDDTLMNLTVAKGLLKQTRMCIDTAESGRECLEMVKRKRYDIIFLDHMMPGLDGIETLQAMKGMRENLNLGTPVISLTANAISGAREAYLEAGFQDYLTKPIHCQQLEAMVMKYLPPGKVLHGSMPEQPEDPISLPDWLSGIDGIDLKAGIAHCGSEKAYLDVLQVFANAIEASSKELEGYFGAEDWKDYTTKVHALKSTARIVGATELSERAKRLEDAGNSGYIDEIRQDHRPLMELYLSYEHKLRPLMETNEAEDCGNERPLIEAAELSEACEAMQEIAASFDYDSLLFVLQSLDGYRMPEAKREWYRSLKEAAAALDWDGVREALEQESGRSG